MLNTADSSQVADSWPMEDEIDLRQYVDVLIRWRREILLIAGTVVALAILFVIGTRMILPPRYQASADVAIVRTSSNVSFDERFRTNPDQMGTDVDAANSRRGALVGLVTSGTIAEAVIDQLQSQLEESERIPANLMNAIEAEVGPTENVRDESDLIRITATADTPEKASAIANAWAQNYVATVNSIYSDVPGDVFTSIQAELAIAYESYLANQAKFEDFIAENRANELNNEIAVLQQRIDQEVSLVQSLLADWQQTNRYLQIARDFSTQVEGGGENAVRTNAAALQALKLSVFGMTSQNLQVELRELPEVTQAGMLADIAGLIAALELRLENLAAEVAARSANLNMKDESGSDVLTAAASENFVEAYAQVRQLRAAVEANAAQRDQLEQQRNLSWESYKALSNKVAELTLTRAAASSEVRFAAPAIAPVDPVETISLVTGTAIAGFLGLFLAVVIAFLSDYMGKQPFLQRQAS